MADRCLHDMEPEWCALCRGIPDLTDDAPVRAAAGPGPWFEAKFRSRCVCGEDIHPGDEIRADGSGGYEGRCCEGGDE